MFIKASHRGNWGWTLVEMMFATGIFGIGIAAVMTIFAFSLKGFTAMSNYGILDIENRQAMDTLTRELRQAQAVTGISTNPPTLSLLNSSGATVVYSFNPTAMVMTRSVNGTQSVLLTNCSLLNFLLYQRNPSNASYGIYPIASSNWSNTVKVVELTWKTSRGIGGTGRVNSENVQTARIVIRN